MNETVEAGIERRRRDYLKLMGLQPWYAKVALENAKSSPVVAELTETAAPEWSVAGREGAPPSAWRAVPRPKPEPRSKPSHGAAPKPAPQPKPLRTQESKSAPARETAPIPRHKPLHYLRIDDSLALFAEDGWEGADGAECRELLAKILQALGKTLDSGATGELAHMNRESAAANGGRGVLFEDLCRRDGCDNLLVFAFNGSELFPKISPQITDFASTIGGVALRVTVTRGLREMLAFPDLKKYCWRDLQRLRGRLR